MKSKTILGADGATKMRQITVGIHGKGGEAGIKAIQQLAGMVDSLKQWNVNTNIGARGACDLVRTLQAQSSTEYWQGLRKG